MNFKKAKTLLVTTLLFACFFGGSSAYAQESTLTTVHLITSLWKGDPGIPEEIRQNNFSFIVMTQEQIHGEDGVFLDRAGNEFILRAEGHPDLKAVVGGGFGQPGSTGWVFQVLSDESEMAAGIPYSFIPPNKGGAYQWVADGITITRPLSGGTPPANGGSAAVLDHLEASEHELLLTAGQTSKIKVYAIQKDGKEREITKDKKTVYRTDSASVADVAAGLIKAGNREGTAQITISYEGKKTTVSVTVSKKTVARLNASTKQMTLEQDQTEQVKLTAVYSDGSVKDVTTLASWLTDNSEAADVEAGEIRAVEPGEALITARYNGMTAGIQVEVISTPADAGSLNEIVGLEASNKNIRMKVNQEKVLQIYAVFDDGSKEEVTGDILWQTSKSDVADVNEGVLTAESPGKAIITANFESQSLQITVQVDKPKPLKSLSINSKKIVLKRGEDKDMRLIAFYKDGTKEEVTAEAEWTSKNDSVADAESGTIVANKRGTTVITASYNGKTVNIVVLVK